MDYRMDSKQKANYMNSKQYKNYAKIWIQNEKKSAKYLAFSKIFIEEIFD